MNIFKFFNSCSWLFYNSIATGGLKSIFMNNVMKKILYLIKILFLFLFIVRVEAADFTMNGITYTLSTKTANPATYATVIQDIPLMPWYGNSAEAQRCSQTFTPGGTGVVFGQPSKGCIFDLYRIVNGVQEGGGSLWNWYLNPMTFQLQNGISGINLGVQYSFTYVIATPKGPPTPSITDIDDATNSGSTSDNVTKYTSPVVYGNAQANTTVNVYVGGVKVGSTTSNASGSWSFTLPAQADGVANVTASAEDSNGESARTAILPITIDTLPPNIGPITLDNGSNSGSTGDLITNQNKPKLNGSAEAGAIVKIYKNDVLVGTTTANESGVWSLTLSNALPDGPHSFTASATDAADNTSSRSSALVITVDTQIAPPTGTLSTGNITNNTMPELRGSDAEPNAQVKVFLDGALLATVQADGSGRWSYTFPTPIAEGAHEIKLRQTDIAANTSLDSNVTNILVDITSPNAPVILGLSLPSKTGIVDQDLTMLKKPTILGTAEANSTVKIFKAGVLAGQTVANANGEWSYTFAEDFADGLFNITADSTDPAGNTSSRSQTYNLKVDTTQPGVKITGPSDVQTGPFRVAVKFDEDVWNFDANDITIRNGTVTRIEGGPAEYFAFINPVMGQYVHININAGVALDGASNPNTASGEYSVLAGSPASEFERYAAEIRQILVAEAERELRTTVNATKRMTQSARERMSLADLARDKCLEDREDQKSIEDCQRKHRNVPFAVNGMPSMNDKGVQVQGRFFGLTANEDMQSRDIGWGDFSILRDKEGSQTTNLTARWIREHDVSDRAMFSYFMGGDFATSSIKGTTSFKGENVRNGFSFGVSGLYRIGKGFYVDGFATYGQGFNDLAMANDVLALTSKYTTKTSTVGGALSGILDYEWVQLRPELSLSHAHNVIGDVGFTGRAYGLTDNSLHMNAGSVTVSELMFRPDFRVPVSVGSIKKGTLRFGPRLICEKVKAIGVSDNCGSGGELGLEIISFNDLARMNISYTYDVIGNTTRRAFKLGADLRF